MAVGETMQGNKVLIWHLEFVTNFKAIYILELLKLDGKKRGRLQVGELRKLPKMLLFHGPSIS